MRRPARARGTTPRRPSARFGDRARTCCEGGVLRPPRIVFVEGTLVPMDVRFAVRPEVDDPELSRLHARAFGASFAGPQPWSRRLSRQSLTWICALGDADRLLGFANVAWDGGVHAFLLDVVVDPDHRHRGVGSALVRRATAEAAAAGCEWLHVDFEPHL